VINLAGVRGCDQDIAQELALARIPAAIAEPHRDEVPYQLYGKLGPYEFRRAWYYWMVKGPVPYDAAVFMYEHPHGKTTVRVAGHCGCPAPIEWSRWYNDDGRQLFDKAKLDRDREAFKHDSDYMRLLDDRCTSGLYLVSDSFVRDGKPYVTSYHIDTQEGLILFANTVYDRGLHTNATLLTIAKNMREDR